jgi:hypothetical protein
VVGVGAHERRGGLASEVFEGDGGVDEAAVEEDPSGVSGRGFPIRDGDSNRPAGEGDGVGPGEGGAAGFELFFDNAPPRLLHDRVPAPRQLRQQGGFAPARAAGDHHEPVHWLSLVPAAIHPRRRIAAQPPRRVMAGLVPAIHVLRPRR